MRHMKPLIPLTLLALTVGCSQLNNINEDHSPVPHEHSELATKGLDAEYVVNLGPNSRDAVVIKAKSTRGGAALRPSENQHVMYYRRDLGNAVRAAQTEIEQPEVTKQLTTSDQLTSAIQILNKVEGSERITGGYSHYELARWERYCAGNPDKLDRIFVIEEGGHKSLPEELKGKCTPNVKL